MCTLKEEVFGTLYLSVFRLQMVAVTAKNTSFDEDLKIVVVNQVYVAGVESSSFYWCKMFFLHEI